MEKTHGEDIYLLSLNQTIVTIVTIVSPSSSFVYY